jgi:polyhydroxyalkanoate synthesis regulator phasin
MSVIKSNKGKSYLGILLVSALIILFLFRKSKGDGFKSRIDRLTEQVNILKAKLNRLSKVI